MKLDVSFTNMLIITSFVLLVLKLSNILNISWYMVLLPLFIPVICIILLIIMFVVIFTMILIACLINKENKEWLNIYIQDLQDTIDANEKFNK